MIKSATQEVIKAYKLTNKEFKKKFREKVDLGDEARKNMDLQTLDFEQLWQNLKSIILNAREICTTKVNTNRHSKQTAS